MFRLHGGNGHLGIIFYLHVDCVACVSITLKFHICHICN